MKITNADEKGLPFTFGENQVDKFFWSSLDFSKKELLT